MKYCNVLLQARCRQEGRTAIERQDQRQHHGQSVEASEGGPFPKIPGEEGPLHNPPSSTFAAWWHCLLTAAPFQPSTPDKRSANTQAVASGPPERRMEHGPGLQVPDHVDIRQSPEIRQHKEGQLLMVYFNCDTKAYGLVEKLQWHTDAHDSKNTVILHIIHLLTHYTVLRMWPFSYTSLFFMF